jgi:hypothetical protein
MKHTHLKKAVMLLPVAGLILTSTLESNAQAGYSSASFSMGKMRSQSYSPAQSSHASVQSSRNAPKNYNMPSPKEILVEEYVNYHRHKIQLPEGKENIGFEMRLGNKEIATTNGETILQIGIATNRLKSLNEAPPVNVSLVIDKSGSMQQDNRLVKAKEAAREFVNRLRPEDHVSIVVFDNGVHVLLPSQIVGNKSAVLGAINKISIGGSTNLNLGMITGYKEVVKNYNSKQSNKVVMLTDAITNTGVVDPHQMIKNTVGYREDYKIDITMIGVGVDFNADLSRQLTKSSRSSIHFVHDAADIKKIFVDEVEAMLSPIANEVKLEIEHSPSLKLEQLYGYEPTTKNNKIELDIDNINSGLTQVILAKFKNEGKAKELPIRAKLTYFDIRQNKTVELKEEIFVTKIKEDFRNPTLLKDEEVKKNFIIAEIAQTLKNMADLYSKGKSGEADELVNKTVKYVDEVFAKKDEDVKRVYDILTKYDKTLNQILAQQNNTKTTTITTTTTTVVR